nr:retrovirus-related Pol polyprotein from transposon TNT 1-94 [Tanacetum cinerariifolium]
MVSEPQSSPNSSSHADPKFQKDYKAEYKKMKAKLALLEASPSSSQNPKTYQPKNKAIRFTHTSEDEIGIDDSSRYPPDEFVHKDDPSRQYQIDSDNSYYVIPHGRSLSELTHENMAVKLIAATASECLFTDFLFKIEPNKVFEAPKHQGWVDTMQEELNQFYRNKVLTLVHLLYGKIDIGSKWVLSNKKDEHGITIKKQDWLHKPPGFQSSEFPDYVYKLDKALYGLKQAPRACPMCKMSIKSKGITSSNCEKNPYVSERKSTLAKAEYVAAAGCCASILWMKSQLNDYDIHYKMVPIFYDNTSALVISNNLVVHSRTKHIDIRYYFIRDHILKGEIELHFIPTEYQLADIFTKPLDEPTFTKLKVELGMLNID